MLPNLRAAAGGERQPDVPHVLPTRPGDATAGKTDVRVELYAHAFGHGAHAGLAHGAVFFQQRRGISSNSVRLG